MSNHIKIRPDRAKQRITDEQVAKLTFGRARCRICNGPPAIGIRTYSLLSEFMQKEPELVKAIGELNGGTLPTADMKWGRMVRISEVYACRGCRKDAERAAAKAPDWAFVEVEDALPKTKVVVQVPAAYKNAVVA